MSKFAYKAEGELNSKYVLDLLNEYLTHILSTNDTKGIVEDDFKINTKASKFKQSINHTFKRTKFKCKNKSLLENYNKVLATHYVNSIQDKLQIFLQTNVLEARQLFELKQTLQAIKFGIVIPEIDENRNKLIYQTQKQFLTCLNDVQYLKNADVDHILYNSPVSDLKPFLSDKVSIHKVNCLELEKLIRQFVGLRYNELTKVDFEPFEPQFKVKRADFYIDSITDSGVGEDVEKFIRSKMIEKLNIFNQEEILIEERQEQIAKIDKLLKRLKVNKIEYMMQNLIDLKTNQAQVKEVIDNCKDIINASTMTNKATIFLIMDNLYYKLSKKCENLQQKIKLKLQLVDKQKMFATLDVIENPRVTTSKKKNKSRIDLADETVAKFARKSKNNSKSNNQKNGIASNLYDDEDDGEISITEDDTSDDDHEDEFVIEE